MGGKSAKKYCGIWEHMRQEYLKVNNPKAYKLLQKSGELENYLKVYQTEYSNKADKLSKKMSERRSVNEELYKKDSLEWILETAKIQEEIYEKLKNEIQL